MSSSIAASFDAVSHGTGTPYLLVVEADASVPARVSAGYQPRADQYPLRRGVVPHVREIPFRLIKGSTAASDEEWFATVMELYAPDRGVRLLVAEHDGVDVQLPVDVLSIEPTGVFSQIRGVFGATTDAWTETTADVDTTSPTTPDGATDALPTITLTPTTNCQMVEIQITANNRGGLADYIIQIGGDASEGGAWDTTAGDSAVAQDFIFFVDGRPVPFFIQGPGTADTTAHLLVAAQYTETITVVCVHGAVVNNTVTAQALNPGGLALDHADMGNDKWVWRTASTTLDGVYQPSVWEVLSAPRRPGSWHPATVGSGQSSFHLSDGTTSFTLNASASNLDNNYDAVVLFSPVPAASSLGLKGFYPENQSGSTEISAAIWHLRYGDTGFRQSGGTIVAGGYEVDDAVMIAFVAQAGVQVVVDEHVATTPPSLTFNSTYIPTVSIGAPTNAVLINGTLTNSTTGDVINIVDTYFKVQGLIITTQGALGPATRGIVTQNGDPIYFGSPSAKISPTNTRKWWHMRPGVANSWAWAGTAGVSVSLSWTPRYRLL